MEWISVKDRMPEEGEIVITFQPNEFHPEHKQQILAFKDGVFIDVKFLYDDESGGFYPFITHWRPKLPDPPKE